MTVVRATIRQNNDYLIRGVFLVIFVYFTHSGAAHTWLCVYGRDVDAELVHKIFSDSMCLL
jgi:hypothetical protein